MSAPAAVAAPAAPAIHPQGQLAVQATTTLLNNVEGWQRTSEFVLSIFAMIGHFFKELPEGIVRLGDSLSVFVNLTVIPAVARRLKNWFVADSNGKFLWQKAWHNIAFIACLTAAHLTCFAKFLSTTLKVYDLGKAALPVSVGGNLLFGAASAFDLVNNAVDIKSATEKNTVADKRILKWDKHAKAFNKADWDTTVQKQVDLWNSKLVNSKKANNAEGIVQADAKLKLWTDVKNCQDEDRLKAFSNRKVSQWNDIKFNQNCTKTNAWVLVAFNIAIIALTVLSTLLALINPANLPNAVTIATLVAASVSSGLDTSQFLVEEVFFKKKDVNVVTIV